MAAQKIITDLKLQVRVENGTTVSGGVTLKNINLNQIKLQATADELLAAGQGLANLQASNLSGIRIIDTYDLAE